MTPPKDASAGTTGVKRDHGNRHVPESSPLGDSVPRPQDALSEGLPTGGEVTGAETHPDPSESARCPNCKTMTRPGFLCRMCSYFVPFPPRSSQNATGIPY